VRACTGYLFSGLETAQQLRTLSALLEDPDLIPSTHKAVYTCLLLQFQGIRYPHRYTCRQNTNVHKNKIIFKITKKKKRRRRRMSLSPLVFFKLATLKVS
jgi:hypothetical protein